MQAANKSVDLFVLNYYKTIDSNRAALNLEYLESPSILYNGMQTRTPKLPETTHEVLSYDSQPISGQGYLVSVLGNVMYASERTKILFSHTFVVGHDFKIASEVFRRL